jgi:hypothetical protein
MSIRALVSRAWSSPAATRARPVTMQGAGHTVPQPDSRFPRWLGATVQAD